jgi:inhibitor of cysteine peptidase
MSFVKKFAPGLAALAMVLLSLVACGPGAGQPAVPTETAAPATQSVPTTSPATPGTPGTPDATPVAGDAAVEDIEIMMLESFPVQVSVVVKGYLSDACTSLGEIVQSRNGNTFKVSIKTVRPADKVCADVISPFEETISLDVVGLKAGTYTVDVNGVTETFTLSADNVLP